jgi:hypothetical protein
MLGGMSAPKLSTLKAELETTLVAGKLARALELSLQLEKLEPTESRWSQKAGDILRRQNKPKEAAAAFERAARTWAKQGFMARAIAMAKTVSSLDPSREGLIAELDPSVAQQEHRKARPEAAAAHGKALTLSQAAPPLAPAPDAEDDEIRFVMEPSAVLDLSEIMLVEDDLVESLSSVEMLPSRQIDRLASLPGFPLFAELPPDALVALLPVYLHLVGVDRPPALIVLEALYTLVIALMMVSRVPTYAGKTLGSRVPREWVVPLLLAFALSVALLVIHTFPVLLAITLVYLALIPWGISRYRRLEAAHAAAGSGPDLPQTAPATPVAPPD